MMKQKQEARLPDCRKLNELAHVCFVFLVAERRKAAGLPPRRPHLFPLPIDPPSNKRKFQPPPPPLPPLRLPPTAGPAPSDFNPHFRCGEKKPAEFSSDSGAATLDGPAIKKLKLKVVFSGGNATSSSFASSSAGAGDGVQGSWEREHAGLGGTRPVWIGEKPLKHSDTDEGQSRLLLPQAMSERVFQEARESESATINSGGLTVLVLDHLGQRHQMVCKFRKSQNGMVFTGGWNGFVRANGLRLGDRLGIVTFRSAADALFFAFLQD